MASDEEAVRAMNALNGTEQDGRALKVSIAKPQAPRENRGGFRQGGGGGFRRGGRF